MLCIYLWKSLGSCLEDVPDKFISDLWTINDLLYADMTKLDKTEDAERIKQIERYRDWCMTLIRECRNHDNGSRWAKDKRCILENFENMLDDMSKHGKIHIQRHYVTSLPIDSNYYR